MGEGAGAKRAFFELFLTKIFYSCIETGVYAVSAKSEANVHNNAW